MGKIVVIDRWHVDRALVIETWCQYRFVERSTSRWTTLNWVDWVLKGVTPCQPKCGSGNTLPCRNGSVRGHVPKWCNFASNEGRTCGTYGSSMRMSERGI